MDNNIPEFVKLYENKIEVKRAVFVRTKHIISMSYETVTIKTGDMLYVFELTKGRKLLSDKSPDEFLEFLQFPESKYRMSQDRDFIY